MASISLPNAQYRRLTEYAGISGISNEEEVVQYLASYLHICLSEILRRTQLVAEHAGKATLKISHLRLALRTMGLVLGVGDSDGKHFDKARALKGKTVEKRIENIQTKQAENLVFDHAGFKELIRSLTDDDFIFGDMFSRALQLVMEKKLLGCLFKAKKILDAVGKERLTVAILEACC